MEEFDYEQELADEEYIRYRRRVIAIIMCGVLVLLILAGVFFAYSIQRTQDKRLREEASQYNGELIPLFEERADIEQKLFALKEEDIGTDSYLGTVVFLCVEPGKWIIDDVKPFCDTVGLTATVAVALDKFPGENGFLSVDELRSLLDEGWELCLSVQNIGQAKELKEKLTAAGLEVPDTIYLPSGTSEETIDIFATAGFNNVITHGDEKGSIVWYAQAKGCRESGAKTYLDNAVESSECIVFTIGPLYTREAYTAVVLNSMFTTVCDMVVENKVDVGNIHTARERRMTFEDMIGVEKTKLVEERMKLENRLTEIEGLIIKYNR